MTSIILSAFAHPMRRIRTVACLPSAMVLLLMSANANAQNLSNWYNSKGYFLWLELIPSVCALVLCVGLLRNPYGRSLLWKTLLGLAIAYGLCFSATLSTTSPSAGFIGIVLMVLSAWIATVILAIALIVSFFHARKRSVQ